jgi:hypothetical protein
MRKISKFGWLLEKGWSISPLYKVRVRVKGRVKGVKGDRAMGYKLGNCFTVKRFYVSDASMLTLLSPFLKGVSAKVLGISEQGDIGYVQC